MSYNSYSGRVADCEAQRQCYVNRHGFNFCYQSFDFHSCWKRKLLKSIMNSFPIVRWTAGTFQ